MPKPTAPRAHSPPRRSIDFIAGFGPIVRDEAASLALYRDALGIHFDETNGYFHTERIDGAKAFALWPLA
ncbi:MAG: hypothetical protein ACREBT_06830 [Thermoplasmata archaeon]